MENGTNSERPFSKSADTGGQCHSGFLPAAAPLAMKQQTNWLSKVPWKTRKTTLSHFMKWRHSSCATEPRKQTDDYHLLRPRREQVITFRLRRGYNELNQHMHRKLRTAPTSQRSCGETE